MQNVLLQEKPMPVNLKEVHIWKFQCGSKIFKVLTKQSGRVEREGTNQKRSVRGTVDNSGTTLYIPANS